MRLARAFFMFCILACIAGCFGRSSVTCDDPSPYKVAVEGNRVDVPDDLNNLEPRKEMPLPEVSPREPRPEGSPCLDYPPGTINPGAQF